MDYELAKTLMDAGFLQTGKGNLIGSPNKLVWRSSDRVYVAARAAAAPARAGAQVTLRI